MNLISPVIYLEATDFNPMLSLDKKVIVLIQGNYCPHCTHFKPMFQQLANQYSSPEIKFATIQIDGSLPTEQVFKDPSYMSKILNVGIRGVPALVKFNHGVPQGLYSGNVNDPQQLQQWIFS